MSAQTQPKQLGSSQEQPNEKTEEDKKIEEITKALAELNDDNESDKKLGELEQQLRKQISEGYEELSNLGSWKGEEMKKLKELLERKKKELNDICSRRSSGGRKEELMEEFTKWEDDLKSEKAKILDEKPATERDSLTGGLERTNGWAKIVFVYFGLASCLMCTYVWGIFVLNDRFAGNKVNAAQTGANNLWGSIYDTKALLYIYYAGFACATVGYFMNLGHVLQVAVRDMPLDLYNSICISLGIFFVSELSWMPCCVSYITRPSDTMWWVLFIQLKISGIAGIAWAWYNYKAAATAGSPENNRDLKGCPWVGAIGSILFATHCAILDGCVWSFYFGTDSRFPPSRKS